MKNKKIFSFIILLVFIFSSFSINSSAVTTYSWYIKRNGNLRPHIQKDQKFIYDFNGFFIDKKRTDEEDDKVLYITFDAGYENGNIAKILDVLYNESVPAAFFLLDNIILKNTELVTRMTKEGHLICNHTKNHKNLTNATAEEITKNLTDLEKICEEKTGYKMDKFFRFPEGKYSQSALECVNALGYKTIFWSFAYEDWDDQRQPKEEYAIKKILSNTHNGEVVLLHPTSSTNAQILPQLIQKWREMGYRFGTLNELVT